MGLLDELFRTKKSNPVTEIDKDCSGLTCVECGTLNAPKLYEFDGLLNCVECTEAILRKKRFADEEWMFNS